MKTVFKGVIDGVEYNTQKEYNEVLKEKISAGKGYSASYTMSTVSEDETAEIDETHTGAEQIIGLPFTAEELRMELDKLSFDERQRSYKCDTLIEDIRETTRTASTKVFKTGSPEVLPDYEEKLTSLCADIQDMKNANRSSIESKIDKRAQIVIDIEELTGELNKIDDELTICNSAAEVLDEALTDVDNLRLDTAARIEYLNSKQVVGGCTNKKSEEKIGSKESEEDTKTLSDILTQEEQKELKDTFPGIYRLAKAIFS